MTALILHHSTHHKDHNRSADLRSAVLAIVWLVLAAAVPLGAVFVAASAPDAGASAPHVSPYFEAKVGKV